MSFRRIERALGVNHQSVADWVAADAVQLSLASVLTEIETVELDELFTFVAQKKRRPTS